MKWIWVREQGEKTENFCLLANWEDEIATRKISRMRTKNDMYNVYITYTHIFFIFGVRVFMSMCAAAFLRWSIRYNIRVQFLLSTEDVPTMEHALFTLHSYTRANTIKIYTAVMIWKRRDKRQKLTERIKEIEEKCSVRKCIFGVFVCIFQRNIDG